MRLIRLIVTLASCFIFYLPAHTQVSFENILVNPKRINKVERRQEYTLPLYLCEKESLFVPMIKDYLQAFSNISEKNNFPVSIPVSYIHLVDNTSFPSEVVISWLNGEQDRATQTSKMHFAGVIYFENHYFLLTDAVASFFTRDTENAIINFERLYTEYDLKAEDRCNGLIPGFFRSFKF